MHFAWVTIQPDITQYIQQSYSLKVPKGERFKSTVPKMHQNSRKVNLINMFGGAEGATYYNAYFLHRF